MSSHWIVWSHTPLSGEANFTALSDTCMVTTDPVLNRRGSDPFTMDPNRILQCDGLAHLHPRHVADARDPRLRLPSCQHHILLLIASCRNPSRALPSYQRSVLKPPSPSPAARRRKRMTGPYPKLELLRRKPLSTYSLLAYLRNTTFASSKAPSSLQRQHMARTVLTCGPRCRWEPTRVSSQLRILLSCPRTTPARMPAEDHPDTNTSGQPLQHKCQQRMRSFQPRVSSRLIVCTAKAKELENVQRVQQPNALVENVEAKMSCQSSKQ
jgi:hypothetical protein